MTGGNGAVLVATPHRDDHMAPSWVASLLGLTMYDLTDGNGRIARAGGPLMLPASPMSLSAARNQIARAVLDEPAEGCEAPEWLLMLDSDMGFAPDTLARLLDAADPVDRPVVGGLAFSLRRLGSDGLGGWRTAPVPTLYYWDSSTEKGFVARQDYPDNTVVPVHATGAACLLVHRSALLKVREQLGEVWFDRSKLSADGALLGEDLSFCARLAQVGVPIHVHTGVKTSHAKTVWVTEEDYFAAVTLAALAADS